MGTLIRFIWILDNARGFNPLDSYSFAQTEQAQTERKVHSV